MPKSSREEQLVLGSLGAPSKQRARRVPGALRSYRPPHTLVALWALRLMAHVRHSVPLLMMFREDAFTDLLGLDEVAVERIAERGRSMDSGALARMFLPAIAELEAATDLAVPTAVTNAELLAPRLRLSTVERKVLGLVAVSINEDGLRVCIPRSGGGRLATAQIIAAALGEDVAEVRKALQNRGNLLGVGLIKRAAGMYRAPGGVAFTVPDSIGAALSEETDDADRLVRHLFVRSPVPTVTLADFEHVGLPVVVAARLLRAALDRGTVGVNILLHGAPGSGKTELARALAADVQGSLHDLALEDHEGEPISGDERLSTLSLCQRMLGSHPRAVVLFDEIEDVFPSHCFGPWERLQSGTDKATTNRLMEENTIPTIWVANRVSQIDPAFLRRFDLSLELRTPPVGVRHRVLTQALASLPVDSAFIDRTARDPRLQLGHVTRAARVAELVAGSGAPPTEQTLDVVLNGTLEAQGNGARRREAPLELGPFDLSLVNARPPLDGVVAGLATHRSGTLASTAPRARARRPSCATWRTAWGSPSTFTAPRISSTSTSARPRSASRRRSGTPRPRARCCSWTRPTRSSRSAPEPHGAGRPRK